MLFKHIDWLHHHYVGLIGIYRASCRFPVLRSIFSSLQDPAMILSITLMLLFFLLLPFFVIFFLDILLLRWIGLCFQSNYLLKLWLIFKNPYSIYLLSDNDTLRLRLILGSLILKGWLFVLSRVGLGAAGQRKPGVKNKSLESLVFNHKLFSLITFEKGCLTLHLLWRSTLGY